MGAALVGLVRGATARGRVDPGLAADFAASWVAPLVDALAFRASEPGFPVDPERGVLRVLVRRLLRGTTPPPPPSEEGGAGPREALRVAPTQSPRPPA